MRDIYLLYDYKGFFGSKTDAVPYLSGMSISYLTDLFKKEGFNLIPLNFADISFRDRTYHNKYFIYTSSEDTGYHYKDYVEDIVFALQNHGAKMIPSYKFLRANNNKVFMELMREMTSSEKIQSIDFSHFGTIEDLKKKVNTIPIPAVLKRPRGAMSKGVYLATTSKQLLKYAAKISRTKNWFREAWEFGRSIKYKGYTRESRHREKFIIQEYISKLSNDWKVLIYDKKYYVLFRQNRPKDFRASGSGLFKFPQKLPDGLLNYAEEVFNIFDVPNISLDIVFDGSDFHLIEFQAVYFGNTTLVKSNFFFTKINMDWEIVHGKSDLEKVYVESIVNYISNKN